MDRIDDPIAPPSPLTGAVAGVVAGAAALGAAELLAGLLPGAASPVIAIGDLVISLQPPGAKQFIVDLFGEADKLLLNLFIVAVALAVAAGLGVLARTRADLARIGFAGFGLLALGASLRAPLAAPLTSLIVAIAAVVVAIGVLGWSLRRCRPGDGRDARLGAPPVPGPVRRDRRGSRRVRRVRPRPARSRARGGHPGCAAGGRGDRRAAPRWCVARRRRPQPDRHAQRAVLPHRHRAPRAPARHRDVAAARDTGWSTGRSS